VGYASAGHFETPHLDALAGRGLVFDTAYSAATICVPNKQTGQLEPMVPGTGDARACASQAGAAAAAANTPSASRVQEQQLQPALAAVPVKPAPSRAARVGAETKRNWVLKTSFQTLEEAIEDFAAQIDYEVIYEAREFPLGLKRDLTIATDADFWEALRVLGETYRKSDGAFQILPTKFKQIVVVPMGQDATAGER
jgi:hypothetical protein